jgi:hypothetical protein
MTITLLRIIIAIIIFIFIFLSGFWLSKSGKPFNSGILTIHKLISLGAAAFLVVTVYQVNKVSGLSTIDLVVTVVTGMSFLLTIVSGGLLSIGKSMPTAISRIHKITPFLPLCPRR